MHIVVTGANGFIGTHLLATLLSETPLARHAALRITAVAGKFRQLSAFAAGAAGRSCRIQE